MSLQNNIIYLNKEIPNYSELCSEGDIALLENNIIEPRFGSPEDIGFTYGVTYRFFDTNSYPVDKYKIELLKFLCERFDLNENDSFKDHNCEVLIKCSITDLINNKTSIKYIQLTYNFYYDEFNENDYYDEIIDTFYLQDKNITKELFEYTKNEIPKIIKEIDFRYYEKYKKEFDWK